jgi:hypothetical protein
MTEVVDHSHGAPPLITSNVSSTYDYRDFKVRPRHRGNREL